MKPKLNRVDFFLRMLALVLVGALYGFITMVIYGEQLYLLGQGTSHWGILARKKTTQPRWTRSKKSDPINILTPTLTTDGKIPLERLNLL